MLKSANFCNKINKKKSLSGVAKVGGMLRSCKVVENNNIDWWSIVYFYGKI